MTLLAQFAATGGALANYIEDVFSTYLYTGTSAARTITNNIDLSGKGGMVWIKARSAATSHRLFDTARGATKYLASNGTGASTTDATSLTAFNPSSFSLGDDSASGDTVNGSGVTYASWTFRKQPKFFDIVTYTGNGTTQNIAHSLAGTVGTLIIKRTDTGGSNWMTYHRSLPADEALALNTTEASSAYFTPTIFGNNTVSVAPTSTQFTVGNFSGVNASGGTYVAYLFAHDAGGFGLSGTDNVISCGSFDNTVASQVTLGWEPQWLLVKSASASSNWHIIDTMRGMSNTGQSLLTPNLTNAEIAQTQYFIPTATGFTQNPFFSSSTVIYIAIRRGPMKVPTTGTSVYNGITRTGTGANATVTGAGFPVDLLLSGSRDVGFGTIDFDRLRGATQRLFTYSTAAEAARATSLTSFAVQDGYTIGDDATDGGLNNSGQTYIYWNFRRAPSFFDEICYTGTGANKTESHNLAAAPELWFVKLRGGAAAWAVGSTALANTEYLLLNTTDAKATGATYWNSTYPTATTLSLGTQARVNDVGTTVVAYLFATAPGVSKVGGYTGTGTTQTINCGFTAGSRFVMIKRTDSTGDWYVWDSARGIIAGNDPYLLFNSSAAEVTGTDYVDTAATGFELSSTAPAAINANGGTYIFLAIA